MKKIFFILSLTMAVYGCSSPKKENADTSHALFMGVRIEGSKSDFLEKIRTGFQMEGKFANLELQLDSISHKSFLCSSQGLIGYPNNIWFEFFLLTEPFHDCVVGLEGLSVLNSQQYEILRICLNESFGAPIYNKTTLTPEILSELNIYEALVYKDLEGKFFEIWKDDMTYVTLQYDLSSENIEKTNEYFVLMNIVDKTNFDKYVDSQLAEQND